MMMHGAYNVKRESEVAEDWIVLTETTRIFSTNESLHARTVCVCICMYVYLQVIA